MSDPEAEHAVVYDVTEERLGHDPRLLNLLRLWQSKRAARMAPARAEFRPEDLQPWLGNIILLDVIEGGKDFRFRLFGSAVAREAGFDMTGKLLSEYPIKTTLPFLFEVQREVVRRACPALTEHNPAVPNVRRRRRLLLPFSSDGKSIDMTLSANYAIDVIRPPDRYL
jgi:hypothetical protein